MYRLAIAVALGVAIAVALCIVLLPAWQDAPINVLAKILLWPITAFTRFRFFLYLLFCGHLRDIALAKETQSILIASSATV